MHRDTGWREWPDGGGVDAGGMNGGKWTEERSGQRRERTEESVDRGREWTEEENGGVDGGEEWTEGGNSESNVEGRQNITCFVCTRIYFI